MPKVINVRVENILGITEAAAKPEGKSLVIGGRNGQGKSSFQQALKMALAGKTQVPDKPVKEGAERGTVVTQLDNGFTVEFSVTPDRKTKLTVKQTDNPAFKASSVEMLKGLFGDLSFDPGDFMALGRREQVEALMRLVGLDFADVDQERTRLYHERTSVNRQVKQEQARLADLPYHPDAPPEPVNVVELVKQIDAAKTLDRKKARLHTETRDTLALADGIEREIRAMEVRIAELREQQAKDKEKAERLQAEWAAIEVPDTTELQKQVETSHEVNEQVRANEVRKAQAERVALVEGQASELTRQIETLDSAKGDALAGASWPVEGLSFDGESVLFRGVPFDQCSESEQWDVATAIAFARNPGSVVFMSRSGGMDKHTRARVIERAASLGVQLFLEVVDDAEDVQILIEHGQVAEDRTVAV